MNNENIVYVDDYEENYLEIPRKVKTICMYKLCDFLLLNYLDLDYDYHYKHKLKDEKDYEYVKNNKYIQFYDKNDSILLNKSSSIKMKGHIITNVVIKGNSNYVKLFVNCSNNCILWQGEVFGTKILDNLMLLTDAFKYFSIHIFSYEPIYFEYTYYFIQQNIVDELTESQIPLSISYFGSKYPKDEIGFIINKYNDIYEKWNNILN